MAPGNGSIVQGGRVGIIGGSIAGCAMAIELSRIGAQVTLFERTGEELKTRGAGIATRRTVLDTLIQRGLVDAAIPFCEGRRRVSVWRTEQESVYGRIALAAPLPFDWVFFNWGYLYRNLRQRVADHVYRTRQPVTAIQEHADGIVSLALADGRQEEFDLVLCADGYRSLGRRTLYPDLSLRYSGFVFWRGFLAEQAVPENTVLEGNVTYVGYPGGHFLAYLVPDASGSLQPGHRIVNWGLYVRVPEVELPALLTDRAGVVHDGALPPGALPAATEAALKRRGHAALPAFYADIVEQSAHTFIQAIYDCAVPAYRRGRICLTGDAGALTRPHTGAGALKAVNNAIALAEALTTHEDLEAALIAWDSAQTELGATLIAYGERMGRALVTEIPDWSTMDEAAMQHFWAATAPPNLTSEAVFVPRVA